MENRLDVIAVGVCDEGRIIPGMIGPFARGAVVAPTGGNRRCVESFDLIAVFGLKREVRPARQVPLSGFTVLA